MAADEIHVEDIGTLFELTVKDTDENGIEVIVDVSTYTALEITFQRPDKTGFVVNNPSVILVTDGADGKIGYITVANDLNVKGKWKLQGKVTLPTGEWNTDIKEFEVFANINLA